MANILVVDDDESLRETLRQAFEDEGHAVWVAGDGLAALSALRSAPVPLIVLLDTLMPRLDGNGVLQAVAASPDLATRHRIVLMSATGRSLSLENARVIEALNITIVRKPFDLFALLVQVEMLAQRLPQPAN
jgi:CheY-like chemotaxis protein